MPCGLHLVEQVGRRLLVLVPEPEADLGDESTWCVPRLLLHLIRAADLVRHREIDEGIGHALKTLQRMPVTTPRGRRMAGEVFAALPDKARGLPAARELRKLTA
ncbi:hypothetical protein Skr01_50250 [Sphaerisporangium krabiense]|nr:hypothetical protein Skr01_50250 [Sphaerisporangium krabiense]